MRKTALILAPILTGLLVGYGVAAWELGTAQIPALPKPDEPTPALGTAAWDSTVLDSTAISKSAGNIASNPNGKPELLVEHTTFDFGTLPPGKKSQHAFMFKNVGDAPLELHKGTSSCFCTVAEIGKETLAPGEATEVTLQFNGQHNGPFSQHVSVPTSDPRQPTVELGISGMIRPWVACDPEQFSLGRISAKEQRSVELRLYSFKDEPLALEKIGFSGTKAAEYFEAANRPLTAAELAESGANSGLLITVSLKSDLPQGRLQTRILLTTNYPEEAVVEVPFEAILEGEVAVVGKDWDPERQMLTLGGVNRREGAEVKLQLVVRGEKRKETMFRVAAVTPDVLRVKLGEPQALGQDNQPWRTPLTITVPPNSPLMNHLGGELGQPGEIVVESNHPDAPRLTIRVRFAVEE